MRPCTFAPFAGEDQIRSPTPFARGARLRLPARQPLPTVLGPSLILSLPFSVPIEQSPRTQVRPGCQRYAAVRTARDLWVRLRLGARGTLAFAAHREMHVIVSAFALAH